MNEKLNNNMTKCGRSCKSYTKLLTFINLTYKAALLNPLKMDPFFFFMEKECVYTQSLPTVLEESQGPILEPG